MFVILWSIQLKGVNELLSSNPLIQLKNEYGRTSSYASKIIILAPVEYELSDVADTVKEETDDNVIIEINKNTKNIR